MQLKFLPRVAVEEEEDSAGRQIFVYLDAAGHSHGFTASAEAESWQTSVACFGGSSKNPPRNHQGRNNTPTSRKNTAM